jgi:hypothetical protein
VSIVIGPKRNTEDSFLRGRTFYQIGHFLG